jgi:hypothetical protein
MESLQPRKDYRLKLDILTDSIKTQFNNFMGVVRKTKGANQATIIHADTLYKSLNECLKTIGDQVELHERENSKTVDRQT